MARLYFRQYYTSIVEQYIRAVVRKYRKGAIPHEWYKFTTYWIDKLSDEDKKFIRFVFHKNHYNSYVGVSCYPENDFLMNHRRLYDLERQFAVAAGFIDLDSYTEPTEEG